MLPLTEEIEKSSIGCPLRNIAASAEAGPNAITATAGTKNLDFIFAHSGRDLGLVCKI
tara:strand:- start:1673 stop:1846 length:174 start_codon:yes stop_codon:yes gene_type:complete